MTREEAKEILTHNWTRVDNPNYSESELDEAFFMAIESLQADAVQPEEVTPHRNYKYLSDYWCDCGWHLGKKGEVKYCAECGRKVNWNE